MIAKKQPDKLMDKKDLTFLAQLTVSQLIFLITILISIDNDSKIKEK
jgi:hypothetical protein